jgi:TatA/E family protein of Tat protein translocase
VSIGPAEIIIVLILALLVFGPKRLPQMGKSLGRGVREFKKAADTAKSELGLSEVTEGISDIKSTFTEPVKEVTDTFSDLKKSVDVKSAIEAPVGAASAAVAVAGTSPEGPTTSAEPVVVTAPALPLGVVDEGPETPAVTPATVFADVAPPPAPEAPPAEDAPEAPGGEAQAVGPETTAETAVPEATAAEDPATTTGS